MAGIVMTNQEQLLVELVNRARANPAAEAAQFSIDLNAGLPAGTISPNPKQPLAPHQLLINSAGLHSQDMLDRDYFDHRNPEGKSPTDRAAALGYSGSVSENISWGGSTGPIDNNQHVLERHEALFKSSGHRKSLLNEPSRELGVGVRYGVFTRNNNSFNASMVTEVFGVGSFAYITGVVFDDRVVANNFYDIGEGTSDVVITATAANGQSFQTMTGMSGGYALQVASGTYNVIFSKNGLTSGAGRVVTIGDQNVKVDFASQLSTASSLVLSINRNSFSESGGSDIARLTIRRIGFDFSTPLDIALSTDASEVQLPATVRIPAGSDTVEVSVGAVDDRLLDGTVRVSINASAGSISSQALSVDVLDSESLSISASVVRFGENAGSGISVLTVSRSNTDTDQPLVVQLSSDDTTEATLPDSVVIPAGQQSVFVGLNAIDDRLFDGTQRVRITAQEARYALGSVEVEVLDVQTIATVFSSNVLIENDASMRSALGTVTLRSLAPAGGMLVNITTLPPTSIATQSSILIPEGQLTGTFSVSLPEDNQQQGRRIVRVTATILGDIAVNSQFILLDSISDGWHNVNNAFDVDGDNRVGPLDILGLINEINANGSRRLVSSREVDRALALVDVNNDGALDPLDVLSIVNEVNRRA